MTAPAEKINLLGMPKAKLEAFFETLGEKRFRAQQVLQWIHQRGVDDFDQMTNMSRVLRERLKEIAEVRGPEVVYDETSKDGTRKWVMRMDNGNSVKLCLFPMVSVAPCVCRPRLAAAWTVLSVRRESGALTVT